MKLESDKYGQVKVLKVLDIRTYNILDMNYVLKTRFEDSSGNPHTLQFALSFDQIADLSSQLANHTMTVSKTTPTDP